MKVRKIRRIEFVSPHLAIRVQQTKKKKKEENNKLEEIDKEVWFSIYEIMRSYPYIAYPYIYLGRAYDDDPKTTLAISMNGWLVINPKFWLSLVYPEKIFVLVHEFLHGMFQHHARIPMEDPELWNKITDAIVNPFALRTTVEIMKKSNQAMQMTPEELQRYIEKTSQRNLITWDHIREEFRKYNKEPPENLEKLSAEDIYNQLYHAKIKYEKQRQLLKKQPLNSAGGGNQQQQQQQSSGQNQNNKQNQSQNNQSQNKQNQSQSSKSCNNPNPNGGSCGMPGSTSNGQSNQSGGQSSGQSGNQSNSGGSGRRNKRYGRNRGIVNDIGSESADQQQSAGGGNCCGNNGQNSGSNQGNDTDPSNDTRNLQNYSNGPLGGDLIKNYDPEKAGATVTKDRRSDFDNIKRKQDAENIWRRIHKEAINYHKFIKANSKSAGTGAGIMEEIIELIDGNSIIPWQKILIDMVKEHYRGFTDVSFKRENRRYASMQRAHKWRENKVYIPGKIYYNIPDIHATFDTSGSMSTEEIKQILIELRTIAETFKTKLRVTQWDWDIQDDRIVRNPNEFDVFTARGRGGTSIVPILKYMLNEREWNGKTYEMQRESMLIIFSDFELFDDDNEVISLLTKLARKKQVRVVFINTQNFRVYDSKQIGLIRAYRAARRRL